VTNEQRAELLTDEFIERVCVKAEHRFEMTGPTRREDSPGVTFARLVGDILREEREPVFLFNITIRAKSFAEAARKLPIEFQSRNDIDIRWDEE
jgi:hypothetical protein